jgi:hypothetical protein
MATPCHTPSNDYQHWFIRAAEMRKLVLQAELAVIQKEARTGSIIPFFLSIFLSIFALDKHVFSRFFFLYLIILDGSNVSPGKTRKFISKEIYV